MLTRSNLYREQKFRHLFQTHSCARYTVHTAVETSELFPHFFRFGVISLCTGFNLINFYI